MLLFIYLFGVDVAFNTVHVNIMTGSFVGRGNQYIQLVECVTTAPRQPYTWMGIWAKHKNGLIPPQSFQEIIVQIVKARDTACQ